MRGLKALEGESFGNGALVQVRDIDYNLLSFEDQIKNDLETDIMASFFFFLACDALLYSFRMIVHRYDCIPLSPPFRPFLSPLSLCDSSHECS